MLQLLHPHLWISLSAPAPHLSPLVSPMGMCPSIPLRGGCAAQNHQPWPGSIPAPAAHADSTLQQLSFCISPAKSPPNSAACQGEPNTSFNVLLLLVYCPWQMQFPPAPTDQGLSQERAAQEILPKTAGTLPALLSLCCRSGPCLPHPLCNMFSVIFLLNTPQGKKKTHRNTDTKKTKKGGSSRSGCTKTIKAD